MSSDRPAAPPVTAHKKSTDWRIEMSMALRLKNEDELAKLGLRIDPTDPTRVVLVSTVSGDGDAPRQGENPCIAQGFGGGPPPDESVENSPPHSFARETSVSALGDVSQWDDQTLLNGLRDECAAIRVLELSYPVRYHRLGTFIIEVRTRLGDEEVKHALREQEIDRTTGWRAEQIAKLYTFNQAAAFRSLRAVLRTLPTKQPRRPKKPEALQTNDGGQQLPRPRSHLRSRKPSWMSLSGWAFGLRSCSAMRQSTRPWSRSETTYQRHSRRPSRSYDVTTRIAVGDARKKLRLCPDDFFNTVVTSPPYWLKRDYSAGPQEIGREPTPQEYIDNLLLVIDEVYRVLAPHGTFWLNLGDTYLTRNGSELPHKSLCLLPYRVAIAMENSGWLVRNVLIWWKPDCMPESTQDRFTVDYEPLFLCTKGPRYYFKRQVRPYSEKTLKRCRSFIENGEAFDASRHKSDPDRPVQAPVRVLERISKNLIVPGRSVHSMHLDRANGNGRDVFNADGANMRCVLRIPTAGYRGPHFAPFPEELARICIDAGCPPGRPRAGPFFSVRGPQPWSRSDWGAIFLESN